MALIFLSLIYGPHLAFTMAIVIGMGGLMAGALKPRDFIIIEAAERAL